MAESKPDQSSEKEHTEAFTHKEKSPHSGHGETHGLRDDIDENTPVSAIKGPSILDRAKEEIEALVETIHPKKDSDTLGFSPKKDSDSDGGFGASIARGLEKVCSPMAHKRD